MIPTNNKQLIKTFSSGNARTKDPRKRDALASTTNKDGVQGEGNYKAAREFNEAERNFVAAGKVAAAARAAAPQSEAERQEMFAAEEEGKRRAKEEDPAFTKVRPHSATLSLPGKRVVRKAE